MDGDSDGGLGGSDGGSGGDWGGGSNDGAMGNNDRGGGEGGGGKGRGEQRQDDVNGDSDGGLGGSGGGSGGGGGNNDGAMGTVDSSQLLALLVRNQLTQKRKERKVVRAPRPRRTPEQWSTLRASWKARAEEEELEEMQRASLRGARRSGGGEAACSDFRTLEQVTVDIREYARERQREKEGEREVENSER